MSIQASFAPVVGAVPGRPGPRPSAWATHENRLCNPAWPASIDSPLVGSRQTNVCRVVRRDGSCEKYAALLSVIAVRVR